MAKSLAQIVAELPEEERNEILAGFDPESLVWDWSFWGRPEQQPPKGDWNVHLILAGRGFGKMLEVTTPIRCHNSPSGWKPIGEIEDGDEIFDENGDICRVVFAHKAEIPKKMFRLTFSDGTTLDAGEEHQWVTWTANDRKSYNRQDKTVPVDTALGYPADWVNWTTYDRYGRPTGTGPKIRTTQDIVDTFTYGKFSDLNHSIPLARPLNLPKVDLPIDPYVLGAWLGDGSSKSGEFTQHIDDVEFLVKAIEGAGYRTTTKCRKESSPNTITISTYGLYSDLRSLGLIKNKHVPRIYLDAEVSDRRALLAGLLDTDGTISKKNGCVEFSSSVPEIADSVLELVRSLGEKPTRSVTSSTLYGVRKKDRHRITWRPLVNPFAYERKSRLFQDLGNQALRNFHRMITKVEEIEPVLSRCLTVDSPNSMYLAGEGFIPTHNTRTGAEWVREKAKTSGLRLILVARTAADVRDTIVEGEAGILNISPPSEMPHYEPSKRRLTWPNGTTAVLSTADEPDSLRGVQGHAAWADELAAWRQNPDAAGMTSWDNLRVATRLGSVPQIVATTTPKRVKVLYDLIAESGKHPDRVKITKGSTMDNAGNLANSYLEAINGIYAGTRLAQQELMGEMLDDVEGALWSEDIIEQNREGAMPLGLPLRVIGVDPSVAENPRDECGIVVVSSTADRDLYKRQAYVLEDASVLGSPDVWANKVVAMARKWGCPVVAEVNQGGALVKNAIHTIDPTITVLEVHSKYGKALRAEPITLAYEQGRVHHLGYLAELESQMISWIPGEGKSPDRVDALVHALTALLIKPPAGFTGGKITARSVSSRRLPDFRGGAGRGGFRVR